jgi:hypothetical protein
MAVRHAAGSGGVKGIRQADRVEGARAFLAELPDEDLMGAFVERIQYVCQLGRYSVADALLNAEKLKRGLITATDLSPAQRRALVDPGNLDLKAIAAGPIMDAAQLYLPAGKISLAEAVAREQAGVRKL